jgi:hypothetical protein
MEFVPPALHYKAAPRGIGESPYIALRVNSDILRNSEATLQVRLRRESGAKGYAVSRNAKSCER